LEWFLHVVESAHEGDHITAALSQLKCAGTGKWFQVVPQLPLGCVCNDINGLLVPRTSCPSGYRCEDAGGELVMVRSC